MTDQADNPGSIRLFQHEGGSTCSTTDLKITPDGSLQLSNYDIGPLCQEAYCHDDCEYDVTVAPKHKDMLLLALLRAKFSGDSQL